LARPRREGLDYFPLDVNAGIDDEIELVEAEYGLEGFAIFIKLLQKIYKTNYYIMWTEKEKLQFSKRVNVDINRVNVIIMSCLKWGLFNKILYDTYKILTSKGIQKRFLLAIDRRTSYQFYKEYLLLSDNEVNVYKNLIIVNITTDNADINPQIERERESKEKVKESKVENKVSVPETHSQSLDLCKYYDQLKPGETITAQLPKLKIWIEKYGFDWTKEVIQMCVSSKNKFIVPWIEKVLQNWQSEGKPVETNKGNYRSTKPSSWTLKEQRKLDPELEKKLLENSIDEETREDPMELLRKVREGG
jgi:sulfite reductase alpha subunit-like flavoprotein